ncbi:hypothetical protein AC1031_001460 [Aphanomyces cochlioides]|nr:hypothetical protein AC1031_001460 [Aphanomyces cochlioides]
MSSEDQCSQPSPPLKTLSRSKRVLWTTDAIAGGKSSMDILVSWLTTEGNYARWKGGDKHSGSTKTTLAGQINLMMKKSGIHNRMAKDIIQKISTIESSYKEAKEWKENTGQGIEDESTICNELQRICPYYFVLDDVMRDRASTSALFTNETLEDDDDENEEKREKRRRIQSSMDDPTDERNKKKSYAQAKFDEWSDLNKRAFEFKLHELERRNAIESKRLDVETKREERLAEETRLNVRLLAIQANSAELEFEAKREALNMDRRIKIIATRKRLKDEGWSDVDVELACPLNLQ